MAVSPSGDPPDESQPIDATCTIRLPDPATVLVHDTTETVMWRRFTGGPRSIETGSARRSLQRPVVVKRDVQFRDFEPTGALNLPKRFPVAGVGNNRSVSRVSQHQDGPEWVTSRPSLP